MPTPTPGEALIAELTDPGSLIVAHLAKAVSADPDDTVALTNFTECDFPGYAAVTITDYEDVDPGNPDVAQIVSAQLHFEASDAITDPQQAVAVYYTQPDGSGHTRLVDVGFFESDFAFVNPGDALERQLRVQRTIASGPSLVE